MEVLRTSMSFENGLNIEQLETVGSVFKIDNEYDETNCDIEENWNKKCDDNILGSPVKSFDEFKIRSIAIDPDGYVCKRILIEGGGQPLDKSYTVSLAYSGYWENNQEPFDFKSSKRPEVVNLKENGILPGLQIALESMLVGEVSAFLFSYKVMYGEQGVPPKIKPRSDCVFFVKLIKAVITPLDDDLQLTPFQNVSNEVKKQYIFGCNYYKNNNFQAATKLFKKCIHMLHKCKLADEEEEKLQEHMLVKLYLNSAVCYNYNKQPLKACIACNELGRYKKLWNNPKALYNNGKALRMIGNFDAAEKRLKQAKRLSPNDQRILSEINLLQKTRDKYNQSKLYMRKIMCQSISESFKKEVDEIIDMFKNDENTFKLMLPTQLSASELEYIQKACIRMNLFFDRTDDDKCSFGKEDLTDADSTDAL